MTKKQKLELTWIGKDIRPKLEPRILLEDPAKSYHAKHRVGESDIFDNRLIFGDNLLALKALEQEFTGKVKCVFIDPPYNTGSAFEHYDDGVEHSIWLSLMRDRLEIIRRLLSDDGSLWIAIDDNEAHYLKVICDEIFGRNAFVASMVWENFYGRSNAAAISPAHNYILLYSPMGQDWKKVRNLLPRNDESASKYKNPDNDPRGHWRLGPIFANGERHEGLMYTITTPSGRQVSPPKGSHWRMVEEQFWKMVDEGRIVFGEKGDNNPAVKLFLNQVQDGLVPRTWWAHTDVGHSQEAKREVQALYPGDIPFDTPKPERLLNHVITIATNPGDLVLDSFAGSGTTGAVAHKMGRRWIMIELGEHCHTHIIPRLQKVVNGEDQGGVSQTLNWQGGGGFRYYRLAPSLLLQDAYGQWVINKDYNAEMLAAAICKLEGFSYAPSVDHYWQHGYSTENDFIYVTTQSLNAEQLQALSDEVGHERTLLVCCAAFRGDTSRFSNLTIKKIPKMVLQKCEWGHDDYSLNVENLPQAPKPVSTVAQAGLFGDDDTSNNKSGGAV
ncbi:MAG: site-specific DNA-methyltransferase [Methylotenera sp.]|uniref:site-specific DNA-methyltransferase n=1 Tax=Methylotenera sp. TaxID=2051956 RepID=UPI000D439F8C|nr:site-specific DNA-methyltransferase [Methylotenera sp.]PPC82193.1 MAG: site-specific DNA-methyltransferase [Methylotenera sp.]PPC99197.1 MAG: site-specific DNA-methyltransferase [Methylotenera sp.]